MTAATRDRGAGRGTEEGVGSEPRWDGLLREFLPYHETGLNVSLHLLTTPLGLFGVLALPSQVAWPLTLVAGLTYAVALRLAVPRELGWWSLGAVLALTALASTHPISPWVAGALVVGAFLAQDLAHALSGEATFESSYRREPGWLGRYALHTFYLLPLVLAAAVRVRGPRLGWLVPARQGLRTRLDGAEAEADVARVADWTKARIGDGATTLHAWFADLPADVRTACERLAAAPRLRDMLAAHHGPGARVEIVPEMNEVYVTAPPGTLSSDQVFYTPHVDGPFSAWPGAAVYRCMLALTPNRAVRTHFPLDQVGGACEPVTLTRGEALAFDFNRTPHYIDRVDVPADASEEAAEPRVNLKLHYLVYPRGLRRWARLLARLTGRYDRRARRLFLDTLQPRDLLERASARAILVATWVWERVARYVGFANAAWLLLAAGASALLGQPAVFVAAVSFVHYLLYIGTWEQIGHDSARISYGAFLRSAVFWKTVSTVTLAVLYLAHFSWHPLSLFLLATGFGLATRATWVLGRERTYFGAELGLVAPARIERFPYGTLPHPMILGSILGMLGFHALPELRAAWPWLVPAHVAFYLFHLAQELRGVRRPTEAPSLADARG